MITNHEKKIKALQDELDKTIKEKGEFDLLTPDEKVAEVLHSVLCKMNHTDQCSWDYESWKSPGSKRQYFLTKSKKLLSNLKSISTEDVIDSIYTIFE